MKKILYIIGIALAAIGCAKDETANFANLDGVINFTAGLTTRVAESDDCAWAENDEVGVFTDQSGEANLKFTISDTETGAMKGEDLYVLGSGERTYYAYHPYDSELSTTTIDIDCTEDQSSPLLWATATSNAANVAFQFSHKLVKVELTLTAGGLEVISLKGAKATLASVNTKAMFDIESGEFSDESASDLVFDDIDDDYNITLYLPPMDAVSDNVKLWITAEDNTYLKTFDTETWESGNSYAYDITVGEPMPDYTNEGDDYYIYTAAGLKQFASLVNDGNYSINGTLLRDIDLGDVEWTPIGWSENIQYKGTFDGGGYLVSGLNVTSGEYVGLFSLSNGTIYNLGVKGSVSGDVGGDYYAGGVVGLNLYGTMTNCYYEGFVSGESAGGVCGVNYAGLVYNCYNKGTVEGTSSAGGVVGMNVAGEICNCYNTGAVEGTSSAGGVVGTHSSGTINYCYWDSSTADSGVGDGDDYTEKMSTDAMQNISFVTTLNSNAATYNISATVKACAWKAVSNDYPALDFDGVPSE